MGAPDGFSDAVGWMQPPAREDGAARWVVTFSVADADATAARAKELGGTVLVEPVRRPVRPHGRRCAIRTARRSRSASSSRRRTELLRAALCRAVPGGCVESGLRDRRVTRARVESLWGRADSLSDGERAEARLVEVAGNVWFASALSLLVRVRGRRVVSLGAAVLRGGPVF